MGKQLDLALRLVARIAANQHGVISVGQLAEAGLSPAMINRRVRAGYLHRFYRGVYAVGHTDLSKEGRWIAAVFACGPGAVLSHGSAAHLWKLSPKCPPSAHVTVPTHAGRANRRGIVLHRSATLTKRDVTRRKNIPVTTPARTKRDMGWTKERTRSDLERAFLRLLRAHELPLPEVNVNIGPYEVDFLWRPERLAVELDSYAYHGDRPTFTSDRARDRYLKVRGIEVARVSDDELDQTPADVAVSLRALLQRRRANSAA